jgi:hypothetical protein
MKEKTLHILVAVIWLAICFGGLIYAIFFHESSDIGWMQP